MNASVASSVPAATTGMPTRPNREPARYLRTNHSAAHTIMMG